MRFIHPFRHRAKAHRHQGFTLIELTIILTIISIIAVVAIPNLLNALDRGRQGSTLQDMRAIGTALERWAADHYRYPDIDEIAELRALLQPDYIKKVPLKDGWDHPFLITVEEGGTSYILRSPGKDGKVDTGELVETTTAFTADIVYSDGVFLQRPAGQQE